MLHARGVATVIITLGARGAFVSSDPFTGLVPSFEVSAVDTTAAGDVFNGAFGRRASATGRAAGKRRRRALGDNTRRPTLCTAAARYRGDAEALKAMAASRRRWPV